MIGIFFIKILSDEYVSTKLGVTVNHVLVSLASPFYDLENVFLSAVGKATEIIVICFIIRKIPVLSMTTVFSQTRAILWTCAISVFQVLIQAHGLNVKVMDVVAIT